MNSYKLVLVITALALFAIACGAGTNQTASINTQSTPVKTNAPVTSPTPADELAGARDVFSHTCARCHGQKGEGGEFELDNKTKLKAPSLIAGHALEHPDNRLAQKIANGGDGMPAFKKRLSPEQINQLVVFIHKELQGQAASSSSSASPSTNASANDHK